MDFWKALVELQAERQRLTKIIASLESLTDDTHPRRGRKSMSEEERRQVSERMKSFWSAQREGATRPRSRKRPEA